MTVATGPRSALPGGDQEKPNPQEEPAQREEWKSIEHLLERRWSPQ